MKWYGTAHKGEWESIRTVEGVSWVKLQKFVNDAKKDNYDSFELGVDYSTP